MFDAVCVSICPGVGEGVSSCVSVRVHTCPGVGEGEEAVTAVNEDVSDAVSRLELYADGSASLTGSLQQNTTATITSTLYTTQARCNKTQPQQSHLRFI